ncbi:zinc finger domain-containing protein [Mycolicibacterium elephantis]
MDTPFCVRCPDCGAEPGTQCINGVTGQPLRRALAHPGRLRDAEAVAE